MTITNYIKRNFIIIASLVILIFALSPERVNAADFSKDYFYNVDVVSIYDGDTFTIETQVWPGHTVKTNIRIYGIDTPEKTWRAKCDKEKQLGIEARNFLVIALGAAKSSGTPIYITGIQKDKYYGRHVATVMIGNTNVGKALIDAGLAVEYFGKGTKKDWCL